MEFNVKQRENKVSGKIWTRLEAGGAAGIAIWVGGRGSSGNCNKDKGYDIIYGSWGIETDIKDYTNVDARMHICAHWKERGNENGRIKGKDTIGG